MFRQMLVAVDFSVWSRNAAQYAFDMARAVGGKVTLLHVLEEHEQGSLDLEAARTVLRELSALARLTPDCLIVSVKNNVRDGAGDEEGVASTILAVANRLDVGLVVIGPCGQGNPMTKTLGRVMLRVLLDARIPVQVVPYGFNRPITDRRDSAVAENGASA